MVFASITFEKQANVKSFLEKHPLQYPIVSDAKDICNLFEVSGYPTNIVIDKNGHYYDLIMGGYPHIDEHITTSIENAMNNVPVGLAPPTDSEMIIDHNLPFKLENGETIIIDEAVGLLNSGKYEIELKSDKNGGNYYSLKKM